MTLEQRLIIIFLLVQALSTGFLWTLDTVSQASEATFALLLAVDLMAFSLTAYMYRSQRKELYSRGWVLVGAVTTLILLFASLIIA